MAKTANKKQIALKLLAAGSLALGSGGAAASQLDFSVLGEGKDIRAQFAGEQDLGFDLKAAEAGCGEKKDNKPEDDKAKKASESDSGEKKDNKPKDDKTEKTGKEGKCGEGKCGEGKCGE